MSNLSAKTVPLYKPKRQSYDPVYGAEGEKTAHDAYVAEDAKILSDYLVNSEVYMFESLKKAFSVQLETIPGFRIRKINGIYEFAYDKYENGSPFAILQFAAEIGKWSSFVVNKEYDTPQHRIYDLRIDDPTSFTDLHAVIMKQFTCTDILCSFKQFNHDEDEKLLASDTKTSETIVDYYFQEIKNIASPTVAVIATIAAVTVIGTCTFLYKLFK